MCQDYDNINLKRTQSQPNHKAKPKNRPDPARPTVLKSDPAKPKTGPTRLVKP